VQDQVIPGNQWQFDKDVTEVFDDMLARSIPQYDVMRQACFDLACQFSQRGTDVVDLGCSRGEAVAPLIDKFGVYNRFWLVEVSSPMLEAVRQRFEGYLTQPGGRDGIVKILDLDLREDYPPVAASVTLCILTLQFTPIEYRQRILGNVYKHTLDNGVLILVEKVLGASAEIDSLMVNLYYNLKRKNGYTEDQIQRKRMSLEGVLVPVTARWNEELLRMAGFNQVDCFWRWMNFVGWIAIKN
jgi:tRNA (cmo5U34)-methyltransferase